MLTSHINHHQLQYELINGSDISTSNIYKSSSAALFIFIYLFIYLFIYFRSIKNYKVKASN